jgi:hypothetical protein
MTTGTIIPRLSLLLAVLLPGAAMAEWDLEQLMSALRARPHVRAEFVETKQLAVLQSALEVRGMLEFRAPDYLKRSQLTPRREEFEVEGGVVTIRRPGQTPQRVALAEHPPLAAFIESMRATLAGDLAKLEAHYRTKLSGAAHGWRLQLYPRSGQLASYIESIALHGAHGKLERIETIEVSGDRSVTEVRSLRE